MKVKADWTAATNCSVSLVINDKDKAELFLICQERSLFKIVDKSLVEKSIPIFAEILNWYLRQNNLRKVAKTTEAIKANWGPIPSAIVLSKFKKLPSERVLYKKPIIATSAKAEKSTRINKKYILLILLLGKRLIMGLKTSLNKLIIPITQTI